jgi:hypothetical protein
MKILKVKKKKPLHSGTVRNQATLDHWQMFEQGTLRGSGQHPAWLELYLLLWFYQHTQRHGSKEVSPEVVLEALQVKALPPEETRRLYAEIQKEHSKKLVSFQKSWALVRRGLLPKNAHFLYLLLHRYADEQGVFFSSLDELVDYAGLPAQLVTYALSVLIQLRLIERMEAPTEEQSDGGWKEGVHIQLTKAKIAWC